MTRRFAGAAAAAVLLGIAGLSTGCSDDGGSGPADEGAVPDPTNVDEPAAFLVAYRTTLVDRDLAGYSALLETPAPGRAEAGFRFYPRVLDAEDFPWLQGGDSWDRATELGMMGNLLDPDFEDRVNPEGTTARRVDRITFALQSRAVETVSEGLVNVTAEADIYVWFNATDAFHTNCVLKFLLAADADGFLRLREMHEHELILRPRDRSVDTDSWGLIKNLYRELP
jgi:hypothetical protein